MIATIKNNLPKNHKTFSSKFSSLLIEWIISEWLRMIKFFLVFIVIMCLLERKKKRVVCLFMIKNFSSQNKRKSLSTNETSFIRVWKFLFGRRVSKPWGEAWNGKPKEDNIC